MSNSNDNRVERLSKSNGPKSPEVRGIYDPPTGSAQYVVACPKTKKCALVDIVQGFDPKSFATDKIAFDQIVALVKREGYKVEWVLDTHPHADHLTASSLLAQHYNVPNAIGAKTRKIAELWRAYYNEPDGLKVDEHYAHLFDDGDTFTIGELDVRVMLSTGHTLGSISYVVGDDCALVHDTLMQPDRGTSRCDFPGGSASELWDSIQAIFALGDDVRLFIGHDYANDERQEPQWEATISEHLASNIHVKSGTDRGEWIAKREKRDATLPLPDRMLAALQVNLCAGKLPTREDDGNHYLKMPVNRF